MKNYIAKLHYKKYWNLFDLAVIVTLLPASFFYVAGAVLRNFLYDINLLKMTKTKALTVSVGNLTTGGVGKTPIVKEIAKYYTERGEKPAILSRGYGSALEPGDINVISDGKDIFFNAKQAGDEPYWLAQNCENTAVLTSANRSRIAKYATEKLKCSVLILDDGFQHRRLARDINIVVVDYEKKFGNSLLLPAGPLREPVYGINRADKIVVMNKTQNVIEAQSYCEKLEKKYKKPVILANMEIDCIYSLMANIKVKKISSLLAFCAIGQPQPFFDQLEKNGYTVNGHKIFADHHCYTADDLQLLCKLADKKHCEKLITTEKDAVKLKELIIKNEIDIDKEILVVKSKTDLDTKELLA